MMNQATSIHTMSVKKNDSLDVDLDGQELHFITMMSSAAAVSLPMRTTFSSSWSTSSPPSISRSIPHWLWLLCCVLSAITLGGSLHELHRIHMSDHAIVDSAWFAMIPAHQQPVVVIQSRDSRYDPYHHSHSNEKSNAEITTLPWKAFDLIHVSALRDGNKHSREVSTSMVDTLLAAQFEKSEREGEMVDATVQQQQQQQKQQQQRSSQSNWQSTKPTATTTTAFNATKDSSLSSAFWYKPGDNYSYSGMWWQHRHPFVYRVSFVNMTFLEQSTFRLTERPGNKQRVVMSMDWLDCAVEHLSKFYKYLRRKQTVHRMTNTTVTLLQRHAMNIFSRYLEQASTYRSMYAQQQQQQQQQQYPNATSDDSYNSHTLAPAETIALIPLVSRAAAATATRVTKKMEQKFKAQHPGLSRTQMERMLRPQKMVHPRDVLEKIRQASITVLSPSHPLLMDDDEDHNNDVSALADESVAVQLAATLASLWVVGMGRILLVVPQYAGERALIRAAVRLLYQAISNNSGDKSNSTTTTTTTELVLIEIPHLEPIQFRIMPQFALQGLQTMMRMEDNAAIRKTAETKSTKQQRKSVVPSTTERDSPYSTELMEAWLGPNRRSWRYVYFTEPDLILHTRPSALPQITRALVEKDLVLAHRWQPVQHASDFPINIVNDHPDQFLPDVVHFADRYELDPFNPNHKCCHVGTLFFPANAPNFANHANTVQDPDCTNLWWECGFGRTLLGGFRKTLYNNETSILGNVLGRHLHLHRRLALYPMVRLTTGTGLPLVDNHQRFCVPQKSGMCGNWEIREDEVSTTRLGSGPKEGTETRLVDILPSRRVSVTSNNWDLLALSEGGRSNHSALATSHRSVLFRPSTKVNSMWWQSKRSFLQSNWTSHSEEGIVASEVVQSAHQVRMTYDWLDLSAEHLSEYWKYIISASQDQNMELRGDTLIRHAFSNLNRFLDGVMPWLGLESTLTSSTLAVIPILSDSTREYNAGSVYVQLLSTLTSVWRIGIGRTVAVGATLDDSRLAQKAWTELQEKVKPHASGAGMEFQYVSYPQYSRKSAEIMERLQKGMRGEASSEETELWLGRDPNRWNYIYYSEPHLIVHTRPNSLSALQDEMDKGSILTAHPLQPIPHEVNFPGMTLPKYLIPLMGTFGYMHELDGAGGVDACCDTGEYFPANLGYSGRRWLSRSAMSWYKDGFYSISSNEARRDPANTLLRHYRLGFYPMIRLAQGTQIPLVNAEQRLCAPMKLVTCAPQVVVGLQLEELMACA